MKFSINSINEEKEVLERTLQVKLFLENERVKFTLPQKSIEDEYNKEEYESFKNTLKKNESELDDFSRKLSVFFNKKPLSFSIKISAYGPMGSYDTNNNIITINKYIDRDPIGTIKHEMVHIMVEHFVQEYSLSHTEKERLVNNLQKTIEQATK